MIKVVSIDMSKALSICLHKLVEEQNSSNFLSSNMSWCVYHSMWLLARLSISKAVSSCLWINKCLYNPYYEGTAVSILVGFFLAISRTNMGHTVD